MTPLEEHLQNSPEDSAAWNVYTDWLLEPIHDRPRYSRTRPAMLELFGRYKR